MPDLQTSPGAQGHRLLYKLVALYHGVPLGVYVDVLNGLLFGLQLSPSLLYGLQVGVGYGMFTTVQQPSGAQSALSRHIASAYSVIHKAMHSANMPVKSITTFVRVKNNKNLQLIRLKLFDRVQS